MAAARDDKTVDIGLCTFRRVQAADTLRSLAKLDLPAGYNIRVIVADNDDRPSAKELTALTAQENGLNATYIHAPARNISVARNACLNAAESDLFAFIDDDELATPGWLKKLIATYATTGADVILGPAKAIYAPATPAWIRDGDFHSIQPVWVNGQIITGYTCNALFRRTAPALQSLRFREDLGRSGGEDTSFFTEAYQAGARFAYSSEAMVTEIVTKERATLGWLLRRRFRSGQTHGLLLKEGYRGRTAAWAECFALTSAKAGFCLLAVLVSFHSQVKIYRWLLRGALHCGALAGLMSARNVIIYGDAPDAA